MTAPLQEPRLLATETVFRTPYFSIEKERFRRAKNEETFEYYKLDRPDGFIILGLTPADEIILVRQYRPALKQFTWELPCGSVDPGESPQAAAERELYEETGYRCSLESAGSGRIMMNRVSSREFCFFGRNAVRDPEFRCAEEIEVKLFGFAAFRELVVSGSFEQLATLGLLLLADWKRALTASDEFPREGHGFARHGEEGPRCPPARAKDDFDSK